VVDKNLRLARAKTKNSLESTRAGKLDLQRLTTERAILAEQLILKIRILANQSAPEEKQLQAAGALWADELIRAGIPPRQWGEIVSMARRARPSSGKAFMITVDQIIDAWDHYLLGEDWSAEDQEWRRYYSPRAYCGHCDQGLIRVVEEFDPPDKYYGHRREFHQTCRCQVERTARNSYFFRRFAAAYEVNYGAEYEPTDADLNAVYRLLSKLKKPLWDRALGEWLASAPDEPTLEVFCANSAGQGSESRPVEDFGIRSPRRL
jgi:hypothetical protein